MLQKLTQFLILLSAKSVCSQQFIKLQEEQNRGKAKHGRCIKGAFLWDRNAGNQKQHSTLPLINWRDVRSRAVLGGWKAPSSNGSAHQTRVSNRKSDSGQCFQRHHYCSSKDRQLWKDMLHWLRRAAWSAGVIFAAWLKRARVAASLAPR